MVHALRHPPQHIHLSRITLCLRTTLLFLLALTLDLPPDRRSTRFEKVQEERGHAISAAWAKPDERWHIRCEPTCPLSCPSASAQAPSVNLLSYGRYPAVVRADAGPRRSFHGSLAHDAWLVPCHRQSRAKVSSLAVPFPLECDSRSQVAGLDATCRDRTF